MENNFIKLGIIGYPLGHTISPAIHRAALYDLNMFGDYKKFEVTPDSLAEQIKYFKDHNYSGFNVTIPHKIDIMRYLDEIHTAAENIGAVNTVKISSNGKLTGYNTDIYGFEYSVPLTTKINNAAILGCGGAAHAVVFGLNNLNCKDITVAARNIDKANDFVNELKTKIDINFATIELDKLNNLANFDILINATPLGTKGSHEDKSPIEKDVFRTAKQNMIAYDLVYNPQETLFLKYAKEFNLVTTNGLNMLLLQGAKAFEIWTGIFPSVSKMKESIGY